MLEYWRHSKLPDPKNPPLYPELVKEVLKQKEGELSLHDQLDAHGISLENATTRQLNRNILDLEPKKKAEVTDSFISESHELKDDMAGRVRSMTERLGFETKGLRGLTKGTWQRFKYMGGETKKQIVFDVVLATLVGAGGTLMFTNSINTSNKLNKLADNQQKILDNHKELLEAADSKAR